MSDKPQISVVLALYNGMRYIEQQIDSILNQTLPIDELIIVDDHSTDGSVKLVERLFKDDTRIAILRNSRNIGVTRTFERGLLMVRGDFVFLSDQDDVWHSTKVEVMCSEIGSYDLVYSDAKLIDGEGVSRGLLMTDVNGLYGLDSNSPSMSQLLTFHSFVLGSSMMFKARLLPVIIPILETHRNHDWWICLQAHLGNGILFISEELLNYRIHSNNLTFKGKRNLSIILNKSEKEKVRKRVNDLWIIINSAEFKILGDEYLKELVEEYFTTIHERRVIKLFLLIYTNRTLFFPTNTHIIRIALFSMSRALNLTCGKEFTFSTK